MQPQTTCASSILSVGPFRLFLIIIDGKLSHLTMSEKTHKKAVTLLRNEVSFTVKEDKPPPEIDAQLRRYLVGDRKQFALALHPFFSDRGSDFQKKAWAALNHIPYGTTKTYSELAQELGGRKLARTVGAACKANPLAIITPCHRVVGQNDIGGYNGGIGNKKKLLALEARVIASAG